MRADHDSNRRSNAHLRDHRRPGRTGEDTARNKSPCRDAWRQLDQRVRVTALASRCRAVEQNAAQMIAHGGMVLERIGAAQELARRVTDLDLVVYVKDFLVRRAQGHQFAQEHL